MTLHHLVYIYVSQNLNISNINKNFDFRGGHPLRQEQVNGQLQHQKRYVFFQNLCERAKVFTDVLCIIMCVEELNN